ncbi:hypothetical protein ScPMuIL_013614 [Solemya velum]
MAANVQVCEIDPAVEEKIKKFRFRKEKNIAGIMLKIEKEGLKVVLDDEYEDTSIEELQEELPEHQPRYLLLSYVQKHDDGRVSYPLCFIFCSPLGSKPELMMMYAGSMKALVNTAGLTKVFEIRNAEEFTEEWLLEKLKLFH